MSVQGITLTHCQNLTWFQHSVVNTCQCKESHSPIVKTWCDFSIEWFSSSNERLLDGHLIHSQCHAGTASFGLIIVKCYCTSQQIMHYYH